MDWLHFKSTEPPGLLRQPRGTPPRPARVPSHRPPCPPFFLPLFLSFFPGFLLPVVEVGTYNGSAWQVNPAMLTSAVGADATAWAAVKAAACTAGTAASASSLPPQATIAAVVTAASTNVNRTRTCTFMRTSMQRMPANATNYAQSTWNGMLTQVGAGRALVWPCESGL